MPTEERITAVIQMEKKFTASVQYQAAERRKSISIVERIIMGILRIV